MVIPPNILRCMDPATRAQYKEAGWLPEEALAKANHRLEREEQRIFGAWLKLHELPYCWHRTDRATGCLAGVPDFWVGKDGAGAWIEFKSASGALSEEQEAFAAKLKANQIAFYVVHNAAEAIAIVKGWN